MVVAAARMAQFARRVPSAGSYVGFAFHGGNAVRPGLGRHAAAFIFYLSLLSAPVTIAAVVVFLGSWLQTAAGLPNIWWLVISLMVIAGTLPVILRGIVTSVRTAVVPFCLEAGGLLLISVVIMARSGHSFTAPPHATGGAGGFSGLLGITFATAVSGFVGWENSAGWPRRSATRAASSPSPCSAPSPSSPPCTWFPPGQRYPVTHTGSAR
jgi:amino acid transporter